MPRREKPSEGYFVGDAQEMLARAIARHSAKTLSLPKPDYSHNDRWDVITGLAMALGLASYLAFAAWTGSSHNLPDNPENNKEKAKLAEMSFTPAQKLSIEQDFNSLARFIGANKEIKDTLDGLEPYVGWMPAYKLLDASEALQEITNPPAKGFTTYKKMKLANQFRTAITRLDEKLPDYIKYYDRAAENWFGWLYENPYDGDFAKLGRKLTTIRQALPARAPL